jgi:hypothetical protein
MDKSATSNGGIGANQSRILPDPTICRARVFTEGLIYCMVMFPDKCPYVYSFGTNRFCRHPQREEIVAKTMGTEGRDTK